MRPIMRKIFSVFVCLAVMITMQLPPTARKAYLSENLSESKNLNEFLDAASVTESNRSNTNIVSEDISRRSAFEKHFICNDGSYIAAAYPEVIHVFKEGQWEEVDNSFKYNSINKQYSTKNDDFHVSFCNNNMTNDMVAIEFGTHKLEWTLQTTYRNTTYKIAKEVQPINRQEASDKAVYNKAINNNPLLNAEKAVSQIQYNHAFVNQNQNISIRYTVMHNKVEEDIIIEEKSNISSFDMVMDIGLLKAEVQQDNSVLFIDENGETVFCVGAPYMSDGANEVCYDINVIVDQTDNQCIIKMTPNHDWLSSDDRVYPILLDPSITTSNYINNYTDTYIYDGCTTATASARANNQQMFVGLKQEGGTYKKHRAYFKINALPAIDEGMMITNAQLTVSLPTATSTGKPFSLYFVNSAWSTSTVLFNNQPSSTWICDKSYDNGNPFDTNRKCEFNITSTIKNLYNYPEYYPNMNQYYGFMIKYQDESNTNPDHNAIYSSEYTVAASRPLLTIHYKYRLPETLTNHAVYQIKNYGSNQYLTVHNGIDANKTNVYQYTKDNTTKQNFKIEEVTTSNAVRIRSMCSANGTNRVLDIVKSGSDVVSGCNVEIYAPTDPYAQEWMVIYVSNNRYKIVPTANPSLALTANPGNGTSDGITAQSTGNVYVSSYNGGANQLWIFEGESMNIGNPLQSQTGKYYIINKQTGDYLTRKDRGTSNGTNVISDVYTGDVNQEWQISYDNGGYFTIYPPNSPNFKVAYCDSNIAMQDAIKLYYDNNLPGLRNVLYRIIPNTNGSYYIAGKQNNTAATYLEAAESTVTQNWKSSSEKQHWMIVPVEGWRVNSSVHNYGVYYIKSVNSAKYLTTPSGSPQDGQNVYQFSFGDNNAQQWLITHVGNGDYTIKNMYSGKLLSIYGSLPEATRNAWIWHFDDTDGQKFKIRKNTDGTYSFLTKCSNYTMVLDIDFANGGTSNLANLQQYYDRNTDNQKFCLELCSTLGVSENQQYYIKNLYTGQYLDVESGLDGNLTNVQTYGFNGTDAQKWTITKNVSNTYEFKSEVGSKQKVLYENSGNLCINTNYGRPNQKFTLVRNDTLLNSGTYYIKYGDKFLSINPNTNNVELADSSTYYNGLAALWSFERVNKKVARIMNESDYSTAQIYAGLTLNHFRGMGYNAIMYKNQSRAIGLGFLNDNETSIFIHIGHGLNAGILFLDRTSILVNDIISMDYNKLKNLRCFITVGCHAGAYNSDGYNLMDEIYYRGGYFALGFIDETPSPMVDEWLTTFALQANDGKSILECIRQADVYIGISYQPIELCKRYYIGDTYQILGR